VLLPGSNLDVDPQRYGERPIPECIAPDAARNAVDELLLQDAFNLHKPILAVCYGAQTLNVWLNGSLVQDLKTAVNHSSGKEVAEAHSVRVTPGSRLAGLVPRGSAAEPQVNSSHHQAVREAGDGLLVSAVSPVDGVIEAVELDSREHFVLGVQWHPEWTYNGSGFSRALFAAFVQAAVVWEPRRVEESSAPSDKPSSPGGESAAQAGARLNALLAEAALEPLDAIQAQKFEDYLSLFLRWGKRINLTAIRDEDEILKRHFVESIACARALPAGIATLLDFGSGAGFPGIPIALCRPEIAVTLAESQGKKAAFLREAIRVLGVTTLVHSGRAEALGSHYDCVTMRAVERMEKAVHAATQQVRPGGWLAVMTTGKELGVLKAAAGAEIAWNAEIQLPYSDDRLLALGKRSASLPA
jgi:16S rRNA (guanine(527)-N(7))-methyltransferase RsmG